MSAKHLIRRIGVLTLLMFLAACTPSGSEPVTTQTQSTQAPDIGALVPSGSPEIRDLDPTTEVVSNCGGISEPVVKHPSMSTVTVHNVEWEVGGSAGFGLTVGEGVIPGGVSLEGVLERQVSNELGAQVQQSNAWDLPAEPGYIVEYTLMWREVWQSGYVDVNYLDPAPRTERINLRYRTGIQSEIVGQKATLCEPEETHETDIESTNPEASAPLTDSNSDSDSVVAATEQAEVEQRAESVSEVDSNPSEADSYAGWVICWHGRDGYEYLIAYPEDEFREGISLRMNLVNAQGQEGELANDSLKMCLVNGEWYGRPDPNPWFPSVSFAQLRDREVLLCSDSPGCSGEQWTMTPQRYFPSVAPALQTPMGSGVHVVTHSATP